MAKISKTPDNVFAIPKGAVVTKNGYVYVNISNYYIPAKDGKKGYTSHEKKCVGVNIDGKTMYANDAYFVIYRKEDLPPPPEKSDRIRVGIKSICDRISDEFKLKELLEETFGEEDSALIMDMAIYMLVSGSGCFQHFPGWAYDQLLYSESVRSDSFISNFLENNLSASKIKKFTQDWAKANMENGEDVFLCYDSTNVNSQAQGVFLVEKGYAKDDRTLDQVNSDYLIRQKDGLPLTFMTFPGSAVDIAEAEQMIKFMKDASGKSPAGITVVADRGYISEANVNDLTNNGLSYLLMLKECSSKRKILEQYADEVRDHHRYFLSAHGVFAGTFKSKLFSSASPDNWFHVIWDPSKESDARKSFMHSLENDKARIQKHIDKKSLMSLHEIKLLQRKFNVEYQKAENIDEEQNNEISAFDYQYQITSFSDNDALIDEQMKRCGFYVLVSLKEMTANKALDGYQKRDCVEKVFRSLKSSLGMSKIGCHTDDRIIGKSLIWFVASIFRTVIFEKTSALRKSDKKNFTMTSVIMQLNEIIADKDLNQNTYARRYQFTKRQKEILNSCGVEQTSIDDLISGMRF